MSITKIPKKNKHMSIRHISMGMICSKQYKSGKKVKEKKKLMITQHLAS